jgi:hypothetical protein
MAALLKRLATPELKRLATPKLSRQQRRREPQYRQAIARVLRIREEVHLLEAWLDRELGGRHWDPAAHPPQPQPAAEDIPVASWIEEEITRLKTAGKISPSITKAKLAGLLHNNMTKAAKAGIPVQVLSAGTIGNRLREWGFWPVVA